MTDLDAVGDLTTSASSDRFRALFEAIDEGYCLCEMLVDDDGSAVDYRFVEVNHLFVEMTGLHEPCGKTALELVPDLERHWIETYARAALGGERIRFQQGSDAMGRWFDVFAMPLGPDRQFGIVFKDDTARRQAELDLRRSEELYREIAVRERLVSLRLQHALLPDTVAEHPLLDIETHYSASDEQLDVGGDWYDTIEWPTGHVAVMVGDVVGHDLEAAATMGRLRAGTKALARTGPATPIAVLEALAHCVRGPEGTGLVTAFVAVFDRSAATVEYASCGHPPALLFGIDGRCRWLDDGDNAALGRTIELDPQRSGSAEFVPGSSVILFTDGLIERRNRSIDDGLAALCAVLQGRFAGGNTVSPVDLTTLLADESQPQDDVIVVSVRRR